MSEADDRETARSWPALEWEEQDWVPAAAQTWNMSDRHAEPARYRSAVPPHIVGLQPDLDARTRVAANEAALELGRFDAELGSRVRAFAPVLLRSEAASSSQIENLTASARSVFSAELGGHVGRNAEQIAANTRAMVAALELAHDISAASIKRMHAVLLESQPRHTPGEWRKEAVWIGTRADTPVGAEFVAPYFERIPGLVEDLTAFVARADLPPIVAVALSHAQFETIHPFTDGNGRTGRALAQSVLRNRGVTRTVAVPVSAGLLADIGGYHRALMAYRDGDPQPIILAFADASFRAVRNARLLVHEIEEIRQDWEGRLRARRDSNAWPLLDVMARRPVIDAATAAAELGVRTPNVYPPLRSLVEAGILKSKQEHRLGPFWRSDEILAALDRFAERAGRREAY